MTLPDILDAERPAADLASLGAALREAMASPGAAGQDLPALFDGEPHALSAFRGRLGHTGTDGLLRHGILQADGGDMVRALLTLRTLSDLIIITDLPRDHRHVPDDYIDPLWEGTGIARLINVPANGVALDMGTGCGVQALMMAQTARQVFAVDVNVRALKFARFNAALNGLTNIVVLESDLFSAVADKRFDLVMFNSPTGEEFTSVNLQHSGEAIIERFFNSVCDHLTEQGTVQMNLCGKDWTHELFLTRIERFLGPDAARYQFTFLENWRTVRGRMFFLRRLSASLRLGINAFKCKAFMKGWLVLKPGPAAQSWQVSTDYHDWVAEAPPGTAAALIAALQSRVPGATPPDASFLPARLRGLVAEASLIPRQSPAATAELPQRQRLHPVR